MKLVIGLGNPGAEYEKSRHNFGFAAVDFVAKEFGVKFAKKPK
jgi:PTH1 family peptidyl-tRNA hydrolase